MTDGEGFTIGEPDDDGEGDAPEGKGRGRKPRRQDEITRAFAGLRFWRSPDGIAFVSVPIEQR